MKIAVLIARILVGLTFFVFGLNGFLGFIPRPPLPAGLAGQFQVVLFQSHYVWFVSGFQLVGGVLLLGNRYLPLALTILGPVIVNILLYPPSFGSHGWSRRDCGRASVGIAGLSLPPILLRAIRPTSVVSKIPENNVPACRSGHF
jgi:uncharacterized membrane protein YphA (DoxX/SURF4 family)